MKAANNKTQSNDIINTDKDTQNIIEMAINQYNCVKVSTSIDRIGASLGYLAQCDYISGNNGDDLDSDAQFGRGYLLDMLSDSLGHFAKNFEHFEVLYNKQQKQQNVNKAENDQLKDQIANLMAIQQKYQQLQALENQDCATAIALRKQIDKLNKNINNAENELNVAAR